GHVLMPGEEFSFNDVVGDRSYEAGFRYAPGITQGELVDVVGGGICQVSSTLFGAAFFAGLEIVHARPHSRPSSYVDMGLDSTVVYPTVDMKLKNPHPFPVVLHVAVSAGEIKVEVLGARRDFKVAFEREIVEVLPFTTLVRNDDRLRTGTRTVSQQGKRGFKVIRRRKVYGAGDDVRVDEWELRYPPTREIVRVGTSPTGQVPEAKPTSALRDPASELRIVQ
ncbi:MAG: VanW family protein, partial [Myxococcales bacterium]|nr:VanW family protein [Myxococcales bacterium]